MKEPKKILDHSYDGIQEYDNPIPLWLTLIFVASVLFAIGYLGYYQLLGGPTPVEEYQAEMKAAEAAKAKIAEKVATVNLEDLAKDETAQAAGALIFSQNCAPCHGPHAKGKIGPNLTDATWIHGGTMKAIVKTVTEGVLVKGMPPWGVVLGPQKVNQVVAYVHSLGGGQ